MNNAIIIGASSGIGKELARLLVKENYKVAITGRRVHLLNELSEENPSQYYVHQLDIASVAKIPLELSSLAEKIGGLDLLIISAGVGDINENLDHEIEKSTVNINVNGFTAVSDWAFKYFETQG